MSIYKRNGYWWISFTTPSGKRIRQSAKTTDKRQAQEFHDRLKADYWRYSYLGESPEVSFEEAALAMLKASADQKTYDKQLSHVEYWLKHFSGRAIRSLTAREIMECVPNLTMDSRLSSKPMSNATKNRYLATMSKILTTAYKNDWISKMPKVTRFKEKKVNIRWITKEEALTLLDNLKPPWMKDVYIVALATGMRLNEILSLEWSDVNLEKAIAWVVANKSKNQTPRAVPLNNDALNVLRGMKGKHFRWVFFNAETGNRYTDINREDFKQALLLSNIHNFKFHDLRHTWASWHVQNGTPLMVLKELGGWRTIEMVQKYAHLNATHLQQHISSVEFIGQTTAFLVAA